MSQPPSQPLLPVLQEPPPNPIPLKEAHTLITTFTTFLTVGIHNILFYRNIYPPTTFLSARAYNFPVHQNRHPKVCSWISDAVDAVAAQLATGTVDRIAVVVHAPLQPDIEWNSQRRKGKEKDDGTPDFSAVPPGAVLERWMFDVARFPGWPGGADSMRDFGKSLRRREEENDGDDEDDEDLPAEDEREPKSGEEEAAAAHAGQGPASKTNLKINWTDVEEQFRAVLRRLSYAAEKLEPLPEGCTFTVAVELKEEGQAPIGVSLFLSSKAIIIIFTG